MQTGQRIKNRAVSAVPGKPRITAKPAERYGTPRIVDAVVPPLRARASVQGIRPSVKASTAEEQALAKEVWNIVNAARACLARMQKTREQNGSENQSATRASAERAREEGTPMLPKPRDSEEHSQWRQNIELHKEGEGNNPAANMTPAENEEDQENWAAHEMARLKAHENRRMGDTRTFDTSGFDGSAADAVRRAEYARGRAAIGLNPDRAPNMDDILLSIRADAYAERVNNGTPRAWTPPRALTDTERLVQSVAQDVKSGLAIESDLVNARFGLHPKPLEGEDLYSLFGEAGKRGKK